MKAIFERKPDSFARRLEEININKIIVLDEFDFLSVLEHPYRKYDFIESNGYLMGCVDGIYQCILLVGEGRTDGLLVESEGAAYCRYAAYIPDVSFIHIVNCANEEKYEEILTLKG